MSQSPAMNYLEDLVLRLKWLLVQQQARQTHLMITITFTLKPPSTSASDIQLQAAIIVSSSNTPRKPGAHPGSLIFGNTSKPRKTPGW